MKLRTSLCLLALVTLAVVWIPTVTASSPVTLDQDAAAQGITTPQEIAPAPVCQADLTFVELPTLLQPAQAAGGCSPSACYTSCRAQGYDTGTCFISTCICRFYFP